MSNTSSKWLMGCGIGCGVVILLVVIVIGVGFFFVKGTVDTFKEAEATGDRLEARFGNVKDFEPDPHGAIPSDRLEAFLAVRDTMRWIQGEWEGSLDDFEDEIQKVQDEEKPFWRILGIIRKGAGAIPRMAEFYTVRNRASLKAGIGLGEYYYIYALAYYAWLGKSPGDGPNFKIMGDDESYNRYRWNRDSEEEDEDEAARRRYGDDVREERRYRIIARVRRMVRPMMRSQLEALEEEGVRGSWRKALEAELDAMRQDRDRLPWQEGLPEPLASSLRPFRDRLEDSYSALLNPLEIGLGRN